MTKNIVVVESPAKAKTIKSYLGNDFEIVATFGHVRDLISKNMGINIEDNFSPQYEIIKGKESMLKQLSKANKQGQIIWLATDPDREGEAIAWHVAEAAKLDVNTVKRVVFNEITKSAVVKAIEQARTINQPLVNAQQARRVLDRLVGFEMSPVLWRKVKKGLSAGRVQSVAVKLIVEREKEIQVYEKEKSFQIKAQFRTQNDEILEAVMLNKAQDAKSVTALLESFIDKNPKVQSIQQKQSFRQASAPFTTSTLQQEAARKFGFSVSNTMRVAQQLYEAGHITYMRTDSVNLSDQALAQSKRCILADWGEKYWREKQYQTKAKGAQEAHEAIRPTDFELKEAGEDDAQKRLYALIRSRALASQMAPAEISKTTIDVALEQEIFRSTGEQVVFEGFLKAYDRSSMTEQFLPTVSENEALAIQEIHAKERVSRHPARFTEAALVRKLEELGIGRPSTYAPTISTIQKRTYVEKKDLEGTEMALQLISLVNSQLSHTTFNERVDADKGKLIPTDIGMLVTEFLSKHFESILSYDFTASIEEKFDEIAENQRTWHEMIQEFYKGFHEKIEQTKDQAERVSGERLLGKDAEGLPIFARMGKFGPLVQRGEASEEKKPSYASLLAGQSIQTISLEEALELFKFPKLIGEYEKEAVKVQQGRFGPYLRYGSLNVGIKDLDPNAITLPEAIELIKEKQALDANRIINQFDSVKPMIEVLNGPYGPYVQQGKKRARIPKETDPKSLDIEACEALLAQPSPKRKPARKK